MTDPTTTPPPDMNADLRAWLRRDQQDQQQAMAAHIGSLRRPVKVSKANRLLRTALGIPQPPKPQKNKGA